MGDGVAVVAGIDRIKVTTTPNQAYYQLMGKQQQIIAGEDGYISLPKFRPRCHARRNMFYTVWRILHCTSNIFEIQTTGCECGQSLLILSNTGKTVRSSSYNNNADSVKNQPASSNIQVPRSDSTYFSTSMNSEIHSSIYIMNNILLILSEDFHRINEETDSR